MTRSGRDTALNAWLMIAAMALFSGCGSADEEAAFTLSKSNSSGKQKNNGERLRIGSVLLDPASAVATTIRESFPAENPEQSQSEGPVAVSSAAGAEETQTFPTEWSGESRQESDRPLRGQTNSSQELEVLFTFDESAKSKNSATPDLKMLAVQGATASTGTLTDSIRKSDDSEAAASNSHGLTGNGNEKNGSSGNAHGLGIGQGAQRVPALNENDLVNAPAVLRATEGESEDLPGEAPVSACIWPPNNKFVKFSLSVPPNESCQIVSITNSDSGTSADSKITGPLSAELKASRFGQSMDGRRYEITSTCSSGTVTKFSRKHVVLVPHDQGHSSCK